MFSPFSRRLARSKRSVLPRLGWLCATPFLTVPARAQIANTAPATASSEFPSLSNAVRPASAISDSQRAVAPSQRVRISPALVISIPDEPSKAPLPTAKPPVVGSPKVVLASTERSATPKPVANKTIGPVAATRTETLVPVTGLSPAPTVVTPKAAPVTIALAPKIIARSAARLPARGGLILKPSPIELRPNKTSADPAREGISDSQRLLLARLDADLARAQKRLNRAESRLSEGQKQLGAATGLLQSALLESGEDARGLHPFVRVAQRYLGTPYVWGGESARGFDCSGFIMRVMRDLGYRALPHSAAEQFRYGIPVAKSLLKPGDIVFFANTYKPGVSHVGIYLGRGRFIHAANSQVGTIVSGLNEPKWAEKYAGARRLIAKNS
ncbi:MAG TPA: NlpC/P60 family protein [Abditibacterium sp.]|jgi:cell wall-associated NlpC family hydrolase